MLTLRSAPASPFGRKVKIAASELGLMSRIRIVVANTLDPEDALRSDNPLGKIPVLVIEDGTSIYDSRIIVDYLDMLAGGGRLTPPGLLQFPVKVRHALADGLMDAALLLVYEKRFRADEQQRSQSWTDHQTGKVVRSLAALEAACGPLQLPVNAGDIAVACALGYLDFRFEGAWRANHPKLVAWLDQFAAAVPSFDVTRPPPA